MTNDERRGRGPHPTVQADSYAVMRELGARDMEIMNLPAAFWGTTLAGLPDGQARAVVDKFVRQTLETMRSPTRTCFLFHGDLAVGNDAASIMAKKARAHSFRVLFVYATDLVRLCVEDDVSPDEEQTFEERLYTTDLLVLSGLGMESTTDKFRELFGSIMQTRQNDLLKTVLVSGLSLAALRSHYKGAISGFLEWHGLQIPCGASDCTGVKNEPA